MRRLRAGLIGSISAWLPSRRSTAHHSGALSMTRSGQVRSASLIGSTSSANGRYRLTGIDEPRWGFQAGWPGRGGPAGLVMVRALKDAIRRRDGQIQESWSRSLLRGCQKGLQTGASRTPATGGRSGSDPVAASEEEHPLHALNSTAISLITKTAPKRPPPGIERAVSWATGQHRDVNRDAPARILLWT